MTATSKVRRSWLLTPVSQPERVSAAPSAGADVIVLDLAEFVAEPDKPAARETLRECLAPAKSTGAEVFVQIDPELMLADLTAAVWPGLDGIVVTRAEAPEQVAAIDAIISELESRRGISPGSVELVLSLETAQGNHNGFEVAGASSRAWGLSLGRADLVMDLRPEPSGETHLMPYLMQRLVTPGVCHRNRSPGRMVALPRPWAAGNPREHPRRRPARARYWFSRLLLCPGRSNSSLERRLHPFGV